jgi:long-chain acyl-CoA synthetase
VVEGVAPDVFIGVPRFYEKLYEGIRDHIAARPPLRRRLLGWAWDIGRRASRHRLEGLKLPARLALTHRLADATVLARVRNVMGKRLRCMISGSAPTPRHLLDEFHALGWLLLEAYGLSENVLPMAMNRTDDFRFGTVGRPVPGNEIVIAADGVVMVRGAGMFNGYLGEAGPPPFDPDGYYRTGDLGQFDAEGYLRLTGRIGDLIKTATGRRVVPSGVESALRRVPGVDQVILIGTGRKCLVALCSCAGGNLSAEDKAQLGMALRAEVERIAEHERPAGIALIAGPLSIERAEITPNLKLRRSTIEARYAELIERLYARIGEDSAAGARGLVIL